MKWRIVHVDPDARQVGVALVCPLPFDPHGSPHAVRGAVYDKVTGRVVEATVEYDQSFVELCCPRPVIVVSTEVAAQRLCAMLNATEAAYQ
jgi:hypothetical protein